MHSSLTISVVVALRCVAQVLPPSGMGLTAIRIAKNFSLYFQSEM